MTTSAPSAAGGGGGGGGGGLRVAIIGAGIAGLATAAFLRTLPRVAAVTLYERRPEARARDEPSAALGLWVDGIAAVRDGLGLAAADLAAVVGVGARTLDAAAREVSRARAPGGVWLMFRADLRDALERCARGEDAGGGATVGEGRAGAGVGAEVRIEYAKKMVRVDAEKGIVWFEDGMRVEADLVVGSS